MLCSAGSFWINAARHVGMLPEAPPEFEDYLVTF
jgi:hypothetical protein